MNRFYLCMLLLASAEWMCAKDNWKLELTDEKENIQLYIDLNEESIEVPTMENFGPMNGYLGGNIYGVWPVTSFKIINQKKAKINLSNDLGSETQPSILEQVSDSTWRLTFEGHNTIKRVNGKKLVRTPSILLMKQIK